MTHHDISSKGAANLLRKGCTIHAQTNVKCKAVNCIDCVSELTSITKVVF